MKYTIAFIMTSLACAAAGCGDDGDGSTTGFNDEALAAAQQAAVTYAQIARQGYTDSIEEAEVLRNTLSTLVNNPSQQTLDAAKAAWLASREPYLQTEVYRFYDGPIDNPTDGPEGSLNAWPMDEAYVDYTRDDAAAGLINDAAVTLDEATLRGSNEAGGEENVAIGYHPIEFLLWGQDAVDPANGLPGQRPFTDYVAGGSGAADNAERRGQYLTLLADVLIADLEQVADAWAPDTSGNFRASFEANPEQAFEQMLTGMIVLSGFELAGERLQVALDNGDQEDEHSCFSDNTHRDMVQDVRGVQNVWLGRYDALDSANSVNGTGARDVVTAVDATLASDITSQIENSLALAEALRPADTDPPFDQLISLGNADGNAKVQALIASLREQENLLSEAFATFGLTVPQPE